MIDLSDHSDGCILPVRAQPGSRKAGIQGEYLGALKVAVTAAPAEGQANRAILDMVRKSLDLKRSQIELLSGATSRQKKFLIRGLNKQELGKKLLGLMA